MLVDHILETNDNILVIAIDILATCYNHFFCFIDNISVSNGNILIIAIDTLAPHYKHTMGMP